MNELLKYIAENPCQGFKPIPFFNRTGKLIEWYWSDEEGYAESIQADGVWIGSIIRSFKTNEVVGMKLHLESIKGLK